MGARRPKYNERRRSVNPGDGASPEPAARLQARLGEDQQQRALDREVAVLVEPPFVQ